MAFNINDFRANGLSLGGARPSLFEIIFPEWPGSAGSDARQKLTLLAKASQIPPSIIGQVEIPYFGRRIKLVGDRVYTNWNVTIMNDEDYQVRQAMETWHEQLNDHQFNLMQTDSAPRPGTSTTSSTSGYKRDAIVNHYSKTGTLLKTYTMVGLFPVTISEMALDWEAIDQVQQFDVEFALDYWVPFEMTSSNPGVTIQGVI
jgi:hypothetical protein